MHVPEAMQVSQTATRRPYVGALDAVRGLAAFTIVLYHVSWTNPIYDFHFVRNAYLMVDVFFVLSGFVIFYSYSGKLDTPARIRQFVWLRFWRLYPVHLTFLFVMLGIECTKAWAASRYGQSLHHAAFSTSNFYSFVTNLLLVQGLHTSHRLTYNGPSWSISVEFYTYLVLTAVVFLVRARWAIVAVSAMICAASVVFLLHLGPNALTHTFDFGIFRCLTGFFLGVITYVVYDRLHDSASIRDNSRWIGAAAISVLAGIVAILALKHHEGYQDLFIYPATALLILLLALCRSEGAAGFLQSRPLQWLGAISYSLYMAQAAVLWVAKSALYVLTHAHGASNGYGLVLLVGPVLGGLALLVSVILVLVVGYLTYTWIEMPMRAWSRRVALQSGLAWRSRAL